MKSEPAEGVAKQAAPFAISEPRAKSPHTWRFVFVLYVLLLGVISAAAYTGRIHVSSLSKHNVDKLIHFVLLGGASFLARKATSDARLRFLNVPFGPFVVGLCATVDECAQGLSPLRTFDMADMAANLAGVIVFGWLAGLGTKNDLSSKSLN